MEAYEKIRQLNVYQAFRTEGYSTHYSDNLTAAHFDVETITILYIFSALAISFIVILPGFRGKERVFVLIRCGTGLLIGLFIFLCNFEYAWESDVIKATTQYKTGLSKHINASIGLHIGLRGINITLKGTPEKYFGETIDYNEHYSWEWNQGREGYGSQAGKFHQEFRSSQYRGLPYPILWIAEYFTFDGEGIRFGRNYRIAGWYTHIMLWLSVPLYLLSHILFQMVIQYGALFLILTGSSLITSNILYASIRNPIPLKIPFEHYSSGQTIFLIPHYSWCFYLNLVNGLICIILGIIAFYADLRYPDETAEFFGIDVLLSYEDYYADFDDLSKRKKEAKVDLKKKDLESKSSGEPVYVGLKRRTFSDRLSKYQKSTVRKPMTQPRHNVINSVDPKNNATKSNADLPLYENFKQFEAIGEETEENQL